METKARSVFREALAAYYTEGGDEGISEVEAWLKSHKGWLPDPQEIYGDGTPLTQPKDEGVDVSSAYPLLVITEARRVIILLRNRLEKTRFKDGLRDWEEARLARIQKWLGDTAFSDRSRSRSPRRSSTSALPYTVKLVELQKDKFMALEARIVKLESELAIKNKLIAAQTSAFVGFQGVQVMPYSH